MTDINKKNEILQAARKVFAYYGYEKTTLEDIGKVIGLNKTSLYYYYKNKESIFIDVIKAETDDFLFNAINKVNIAEGCKNKVLIYLSELLRFSQNTKVLDGLSNENLMGFRPFIKKLSEDLMKNHIQHLTEILETSIKDGELEPCDTSRIAVSILTIAQAIANKNDCGFDGEQITEDVASDAESSMIFTVSLVLDGLINKNNTGR